MAMEAALHGKQSKSGAIVIGTPEIAAAVSMMRVYVSHSMCRWQVDVQTRFDQNLIHIYK